MELVILCGLQASGKSTYQRTVLSSTHVVVSKDLMGRNRKNKGEYQEALIREALGSGRSVVVDNTNPRVEDRQSLVLIAREYSARVIGLYFRSTRELAIERNNLRQGRARVPYVAIANTLKMFSPPTWSEGYDEFYEVTWGSNQTFIKVGLPNW